MQKEPMDTEISKSIREQFDLHEENEVTNSLEGMKLESNINLNPNAKTFIPKSQRRNDQTTNDKQLNLNLNASEWKPNYNNSEQLSSNNQENLNEEEEPEEDEFEMIMRDIINHEAIEEMDEDDEGDEDRWFPKYKDCECCKGFVYKCKGPACVHMNACFCKMKDDCDYEM